MYFKHFEKFHEFAISDLRRATTLAHTNFLVAMGVFNYIEAIGAFCLINSSKCEERFNKGLDLMGKKYKEVRQGIDNLQLQEIVGKKKDGTDDIKTRSVYDLLRCGMSHGYLVKTYLKHNINFEIIGVKDEGAYWNSFNNNDCGIKLYKENDKEIFIKIINPRLIEDLNFGFEMFKSELSNNKNLQNTFKKRAELIGLERLI